MMLAFRRTVLGVCRRKRSEGLLIGIGNRWASILLCFGAFVEPENCFAPGKVQKDIFGIMRLLLLFASLILAVSCTETPTPPTAPAPMAVASPSVDPNLVRVDGSEVRFSQVGTDSSRLAISIDSFPLLGAPGQNWVARFDDKNWFLMESGATTVRGASESDSIVVVQAIRGTDTATWKFRYSGDSVFVLAQGAARSSVAARRMGAEEIWHFLGFEAGLSNDKLVFRVARSVAIVSAAVLAVPSYPLAAGAVGISIAVAKNKGLIDTINKRVIRFWDDGIASDIESICNLESPALARMAAGSAVCPLPWRLPPKKQVMDSTPVNAIDTAPRPDTTRVQIPKDTVKAPPVSDTTSAKDSVKTTPTDSASKPVVVPPDTTRIVPVDTAKKADTAKKVDTTGHPVSVASSAMTWSGLWDNLTPCEVSVTPKVTALSTVLQVVLKVGGSTYASAAHPAYASVTLIPPANQGCKAGTFKVNVSMDRSGLSTLNFDGVLVQESTPASATLKVNSPVAGTVAFLVLGGSCTAR